MKCPKCAGSGWVLRDDGVARCQCYKRPSAAPLTDEQFALLVIASTRASHQLAAITGYPMEKVAREPVAEALTNMCSSAEEVEYVVRRAVGLHMEWKTCGVPGLRQILISRTKPRDGIESGPEARSEAYPEGIPSESDGLPCYEAERRQIPGPPDKGLLLTSGEKTVDLSDEIWRAAQAKRMPPSTPPEKKPVKLIKPLTEADFPARRKR